MTTATEKPIRKSASKAKALQGLQKIRETLRKSAPGFDTAEASVQDAEAFSASVKAELRRRRKEIKLGQTQIGAMLDLGQSAISKIEKGRGDLGLETLYQYAEALGLRPAVVFVQTAESFAGSQTSALPEVNQQQLPEAYAVKASAVEGIQVALLRTVTDCMPGIMAGFVKRAA
jgi:transcriptional regulator with XRE-family HTH domain